MTIMASCNQVVALAGQKKHSLLRAVFPVFVGEFFFFSETFEHGVKLGVIELDPLQKADKLHIMCYFGCVILFLIYL